MANEKEEKLHRMMMPKINASLSHQLLHADSKKSLCKRKHFLLLCITTKPKRKASWTNMVGKGLGLSAVMLFLDQKLRKNSYI